MTLRELIERVERESLHPTTLDLPLSIRRVIEHKFYPDETVYFEVEEVQVSSAEGVVIKLRRDDE